MKKKLLRTKNILVNFVASKMYNNLLAFHSHSHPDPCRDKGAVSSSSGRSFCTVNSAHSSWIHSQYKLKPHTGQIQWGVLDPFYLVFFPWYSCLPGVVLSQGRCWSWFWLNSSHSWGRPFSVAFERSKKLLRIQPNLQKAIEENVCFKWNA